VITTHFEVAVAERGDGAAPVSDRDRGGPVGDHEHPLRSAQVAHRGRAEHGGDRLAHARLVGEQELAASGGGAGGDRVGRLVLVPARLETLGRFGDRRQGLARVEAVLEEAAQGVRARGVGREMRGQGAADVQVHLHRRVPGGALDLCAVGDVEHPQPLPGADERQLPRRRCGPRAARGLPTGRSAAAAGGSAVPMAGGATGGGHRSRLPGDALPVGEGSVRQQSAPGQRRGHRASSARASTTVCASRTAPSRTARSAAGVAAASANSGWWFTAGRESMPR
jgi:hypothetical protein